MWPPCYAVNTMVAIHDDVILEDSFALCFLHFRISESLGSGQFGLVNRGEWSSPHGNIDVALKTLNDDASQEDRVKFLQEATIMGQFKHLNVVQLYGIIIHGQPVSFPNLLSKMFLIPLSGDASGGNNVQGRLEKILAITEV